MNKIFIIAIFATLIFPAIAELPHIDIVSNIKPTEIWASDTGDHPYPKSTTVTLKITGDGNPYNINRPIDIIFAIDSSGSMGNNDPDGHRINAAWEFIDKLNHFKDRAGIVSWNDDVVFDLPLTHEFFQAKQSAANVGTGGGTNLDNGLARSVDLLILQPRRSTKVIIFLSDGEGTYTMSGIQGSEADRARSSDILIYTIGLGNDSNEEYLEDIAKTTGGKYFFAPKSIFLEDIYDDIFTRISNIAARDIEVTYSLPSQIEPIKNTADVSFDDKGNRILKWTNRLLALGETWEISFSVMSAYAGTFVLGEDSKAEYVNYNDELESLSIKPASLLVKTPVKIGDRIWVDKNGNGVQDPDERGKEGITVVLQDEQKMPTGEMAVTDFNGSYQLSVFQKGTYYIQLTIPVGYILSPQKPGINAEKDCDFGSDGISRPIYLANQSDSKIDAGLVPNDCISGRLWIDSDINGRQDAGENGYSGASVDLLDALKSPAGPKNLTDSNGVYQFNMLEPGTYYIRFKAPNGSVLSQEMLSDEQENIYPSSYGTSKPVVLTDGCNKNVDMAIIPLCRNSIYLKDISGEGLVDYSTLIRLFGENFPAASDDEKLHLFITDRIGKPLAYWIEDWNSTTKTSKIWVRVPFIPAGNETEILMQYYLKKSTDRNIKNPQGNGYYVFEFFDDFNDDSLDEGTWTSRTDANGSIVERNGQAQIHTNARSWSSADLILDRSFKSGRAMRFRANVSAGQSHDRKGMGFMNTNVGDDTNSVGPSIYWRAQDRDIFAHHILPVMEKDRADVKLSRAKSNYEGGNSTWEIKWLGFRIVYSLDSHSFVHDTDGTPSIEISPRFCLNTSLSSLSSDIFVDWVLVRRCVEREPTSRFGQKICMNEEDLSDE